MVKTLRDEARELLNDELRVNKIQLIKWLLEDCEANPYRAKRMEKFISEAEAAGNREELLQIRGRAWEERQKYVEGTI